MAFDSPDRGSPNLLILLNMMTRQASMMESDRGWACVVEASTNMRATSSAIIAMVIGPTTGEVTAINSRCCKAAGILYFVGTKT